MWGSYEISATSVFLNLMWMSSKQFYPLKDFSIWPNTEELLWKIHCSLGMHKLRFDFVATTIGFIFQTFSSLLQSLGGVHLAVVSLSNLLWMLCEFHVAEKFDNRSRSGVTLGLFWCWVLFRLYYFFSFLTSGSFEICFMPSWLVLCKWRSIHKGWTVCRVIRLPSAPWICTDHEGPSQQCTSEPLVWHKTCHWGRTQW